MSNDRIVLSSRKTSAHNSLTNVSASHQVTHTGPSCGNRVNSSAAVTQKIAGELGLQNNSFMIGGSNFGSVAPIIETNFETRGKQLPFVQVKGMAKSPFGVSGQSKLI